MTYQITIIKLEGYGAWTLGLGSDREHRLQILQSNIYSDLQEHFSQRSGIVFSNRFDEFIVLTNKISIEEHKKIYEEIKKKYKDIAISMSIGNDESPLKAIKKIQKIKTAFKNKNELFANIYAVTDDRYFLDSQNNNYDSQHMENGSLDIKILHLDVDSSSKKSKELSAYEVTNMIVRLYSKMSDIFLKEESLAFYLGGDNFMIIAKNDINTEKIKKMIEILNSSMDLKLNCGIGNGTTARKAIERATNSLDTIREFRKTGKLINVYETS